MSLHPTSVLENKMGQGRLSAPHSSHPQPLAIPNRTAVSCLHVGNDAGYRLGENELVWDNAHAMDHAVDEHRSSCSGPGLV